MTKTQLLQASIISLVLVAAAAATLAVQYFMQALQHGLSSGGGIRVSQSNVCSDDTHFTGCSSIL